MFNGVARVTSSVDLTDEVRRSLEDLGKKQVYIGIPEGNDRGQGEGGSITNAELLYVHTHGVRQQAMREEMNPAVESGEMPYSRAYELFIQSHGSPLWQSPPRPVIEPAIEHNKEVIAKQLQKVVTTALDGKDPTVELEKTGMLGQNIARDWFTDPANDWAPNTPETSALKGSDRPLIDTGELRRAITYVVGEE